MAHSSTTYKPPILLSRGKDKNFSNDPCNSWMRLTRILFNQLGNSSAQLRIMLVLCALENGKIVSSKWICYQTGLLEQSYMRARHSLEERSWITVNAYSSIIVNYDKIYECENKIKPKKKINNKPTPHISVRKILGKIFRRKK